MKRHSKKLGVLLLLVISVVFMSLRSAQAEKEETKFNNLKV